jgi:hypothetical protein
MACSRPAPATTTTPTSPCSGRWRPWRATRCCRRATPAATATVGQRVGLVVGLLRNCATTPVGLHAARLLNQAGEGHTATVSRFWVAPVPPAQPGIVLPAGQLAGTQPLPGQVTVQPTPGSPTRALVLELRTSRPGEFRVDAVTLSYRSGSRSYASPFASNARLTIGHGRH